MLLMLQTCRLVTPGYLPPELWGPPVSGLPPCVNYDVLLPEVTRLTNQLPQTLAELGFSNILTDLEELRNAGKIPFRGPEGILSGHWTRARPVINLIYNVTVGGVEQLFSFPSSQFDNLSPTDTLQGPIQGLLVEMMGFPGNYPNTAAEATPSLVPDYVQLLDSFDCSLSGANCDLTRGEDDVIQLGNRWSIVERPAIEYDPGEGGAVRPRIRILRHRGFRPVLEC
ncbi:uncharacterized protein [Branchiostoma lanceolatum]|uniref:uncharacterized protein n=1 Tax=Branchiostoma lanceolatum TaxID=7740 RepID=UPI003455DF7C